MRDGLANPLPRLVRLGAWQHDGHALFVPVQISHVDLNEFATAKPAKKTDLKQGVIPRSMPVRT